MAAEKQTEHNNCGD